MIKSNLEDYLETAPDTYAETTVLENTETKTEETTVSENAENETKAKSTIIISSPITGNAADLSTVPDEAFAGRMMGDGAAVTQRMQLLQHRKMEKWHLYLIQNTQLDLRQKAVLNF